MRGLWFVLFVGAMCFVISFPVEGLAGAAFGLAGIGLVWAAYLICLGRHRREGGDPR